MLNHETRVATVQYTHDRAIIRFGIDTSIVDVLVREMTTSGVHDNSLDADSEPGPSWLAWFESQRLPVAQSACIR